MHPSPSDDLDLIHVAVARVLDLVEALTQRPLDPEVLGEMAAFLEDFAWRAVAAEQRERGRRTGGILQVPTELPVFGGGRR